MKTAKSAPTNITWDRSYDGRYGTIHVYNITFEDGTEGIFTTTKPEDKQDKFTVGKEVTYTAKDETDRRGNAYTKIDIFKEKPQSGSRGNRSFGSEESIVASVCLDCANILVEKQMLQENINPDLKSLHAMADKFYDYIMSKAGNDVQLRINYQSRLKEIVNYFLDYPKLKITNSNEILEYVEKEVAYIKTKMK